MGVSKGGMGKVHSSARRFCLGWAGILIWGGQMSWLCGIDGRDEEDAGGMIMKKRPRIILELLLYGGEKDGISSLEDELGEWKSYILCGNSFFVIEVGDLYKTSLV